MKRSLCLLSLLLFAISQSAFAQGVNDAAALHRLGTQLYKAGQFSQAVDAFRQAIELKPDSAKSYRGLGSSYYRLGQYNQALEAYKQATRLKANYPEAYRNVGLAYVRLFKYEEAIEQFNQSLQQNPRLGFAYYNRAFTNLFLARGDMAAVDAQSFLDQNGWLNRLSLDMALVAHFGYRQAGREADARRVLDEARERCDASIWSYSVVQYLRGEMIEQSLLSASSYSGKSVEARAYIGLNLSLSGRRIEALGYLRWVKDNGSEAQVSAYRLALAELQRLNG